MVPPNTILHYEFNQEACGCWLVYDIPTYGPTCHSGLVLNPYAQPFSYYDACIPQEKLDKVFDHGLGPDCRPSFGNEATSSFIIDVDRAMS